jgi:hypothetical protein
MFTEARKIHLIEEVLKTTNESTLVMLEALLKKSTQKPVKKTMSAHDFSGVWSKKDAALIEKAIQESCEQIHGDDWK